MNLNLASRKKKSANATEHTNTRLAGKAEGCNTRGFHFTHGSA